ncbi:MAG: hypothetical protein AUJ56_09555 [Zetaproteobacteria bacterium CG1_02_49_23]|nr:MAG: hypothetical protein AUJ56_09555 [Zetaproteobacteria bacterium CG1_02_49_23]
MVILQQWEHRLPAVAEVALVGLMAWMVSVWLVPETSLETRLVLPVGVESKEVLDVVTMATIPLFGEFKKEVVQAVPKPVVQAKPQPVAISRINLKLLGTVVAGDRSAAIVILDGKSDQQVLFQGDEIKPEITLAEVFADAIVVMNHGNPERIEMDANAKLVSTPAPVSPPLSAVEQNAASRHQSVDRNHLQGQLRNFSSLLSQARVIPNFSNGKANGFIITDIVPASLYEQIGLQNGDVIKKVNGEEIVSAQQAMQMYQALQNATSISLELERAGQVREINYDIQ